MSPAEAAAAIGRISDRLGAGIFTSALAQTEIEQVADAVQDALQGAAPRQTGAFADSISHTTSGIGRGTTITYTAMNPPLDFIIHGTAPHGIDPVNAQALYWPGAAHPVRHVNHPGTAPNPFAVPVATQAVGALADELAAIVVAAVHGAVAGD